MQGEPPQLEVAENDGIAVVALSGMFLDEIAIVHAGERLSALVARKDRPRLILDFAGVSHLSSSMAIAMLTSLNREVRDKGGELRLCSIDPGIFRIFQILRADNVFRVFESRAEALESMCQ